MSAPKTDNCPFCGADKHMVLPPNCTKTGDYNHGDNAQPIVRCMTCYAEAMGSPWDYTKESAVTAWNTRTDLSQASVAAALEAAAMAAKLAGPDQALRDCELSTVGKDRRVMSMRCEAAIRALITPAQHDAIAAHVAAEVAKARAEDAAKIDGSAGVRIQDVAQYLIDHMPAYNSEHPCWEALQDANDDGADEDDCIRAWLRSIAQIGAKP